MGRGGQKQKTDKRDAGELCDSLDRYLRGQKKALSVVAVPTEEQEEKRALIRYHRQIMKDRGRCEARGKGLLCAQGIQVRGRWWQGDTWPTLTSDPRLKDWMKEQLVGWRNKILSTDEEQSALRKRIAALAGTTLLAIRPHHVRVDHRAAPDSGAAKVANIENLGSEHVLHLDYAGQHLAAMATPGFASIGEIVYVVRM